MRTDGWDSYEDTAQTIKYFGGVEKTINVSRVVFFQTLIIKPGMTDTTWTGIKCKVDFKLLV